MRRLLFLIASLCCFCSTANAQYLDRSLKYQGEVNIGYGLAATNNADQLTSSYLGSLTQKNYLLIETLYGVRLSPHFFTGIGAKMCANENLRTAQLPIFANFKYYPLYKAFAPYVSIDVGYSLWLYNRPSLRLSVLTPAFCGFHGAAGIGFNYKHLNFGLGCQIQQMRYPKPLSNYICTSIFLKVGAKF